MAGKARFGYGWYSTMTGTGSLSASSGSQTRAAIRSPSGRGMHRFSISRTGRGSSSTPFTRTPGSAAIEDRDGQRQRELETQLLREPGDRRSRTRGMRPEQGGGPGRVVHLHARRSTQDGQEVVDADHEPVRHHAAAAGDGAFDDVGEDGRRAEERGIDGLVVRQRGERRTQEGPDRSVIAARLDQPRLV